MKKMSLNFDDVVAGFGIVRLLTSFGYGSYVLCGMSANYLATNPIRGTVYSSLTGFSIMLFVALVSAIIPAKPLPDLVFSVAFLLAIHKKVVGIKTQGRNGD